MNAFKKDNDLENKIKKFLLLLTFKFKQDINCRVFYKSYFKILFKDIHNNVKTENNKVIHGGGNLNSSFTQLLLLFMTMKTSLASSIIPDSMSESNDAVQTTKLLSFQNIEPYSTWFLTTRENVANH